jgi:hypothetical protein
MSQKKDDVWGEIFILLWLIGALSIPLGWIFGG